MTIIEEPPLRRGRKYDQVIEGARVVFLRDGFEGANVDEISREAGVSKATLYSYFRDKRLLFLEMAKREILRISDDAVAHIDVDAPVREVLRDAGLRILEFFSSDFGQRVFRICVAESERFPAVGKEFHEAVQHSSRAPLISFLMQAHERGEMEIEDFVLAAEQFHELCKVDIFPRIIFNLETKFTADERERIVDSAVEMMMARYGAR